jgi:glycosyltransferase involved in cell wall biosynthesis
MKIAILTYTFPPKWLSGTEIATYNIAKYLAKRGLDVYVITSKDNGLPDIETRDGFQIYRTKFPKIKFLGCIIFWMNIIPILKKIDPDVIHSQMIGMGVPALAAKKLFGVPYIVWGRGSDVHLSRGYERFILKPVLKKADAVIVLTEDMKKDVGAFCDRDVSVIPNGVDLEKFNNLSKKDLRAKLQIGPDEKVITFIGRLHPVKGVLYLIKAMNLVKDKEPKAKLLLIGDGEDRDALKETANKLNLERFVTFLQQIPAQNIPEYTVASDVFVLPSLSEGFPLTVLEAMASGLPIVTTRVRGLPEIVTEGENGFLVEPKNPQQLAEKILLILKNDELRLKMSLNNREKAKQYRWESVVDKLEKIYFEITSPGQRPA